MPKSNRAFWKKKFELNQARDARKEAALREAGWSVEVIWECQVQSYPDSVKDRLVEVLEEADKG